MTDKLALSDTSPSWYADGLPFECTGCGGCCTGSPGYTWASEAEILQMAIYLKMSPLEFGRRFLRRVGNRYSLLETKPHYDCIFLQDKRCRIYPVRPTQCRTFPFWPENLRSQEDWQETARRCEGIRCEATRVPFTDIERQRQEQIRAED